MATYNFETITAAEATAYTTADTLVFTTPGATDYEKCPSARG